MHSGKLNSTELNWIVQCDVLRSYVSLKTRSTIFIHLFCQRAGTPEGQKPI